MSASNPGPVRRFFRGVWRVVDVSRRVVLNLLFLLILPSSSSRWSRSGPPPLRRQDRARARPRRLDRRAARRQPALDRARPAARRDDAAEDAAARRARGARHRRQGRQDLERRADPRRARRRPASRRCARSPPRSTASGQRQEGRRLGLELRPAPVLHRRACRRGLPASAWAWSTSPASAAVRNYYKDALDKLGVTVNVLRVGTFKELRRAVHRQRAVARGARGRHARSTASSGRPTPTTIEKRAQARRPARSMQVDRRGAAAARRRPAATAPSWRSPTSSSTA